jgi:hypothetical protein
MGKNLAHCGEMELAPAPGRLDPDVIHSEPREIERNRHDQPGYKEASQADRHHLA